MPLVPPVSGQTLRRLLVLALLLTTAACATVRGRADDALERGDYQSAVALYSQLHRREPNDPEIQQRLTKSERGLLDQLLTRAEAARNGGSDDDTMRISLEVAEMTDRMQPGTIDPPRERRVRNALEASASKVRTAVRSETSRGRALAARAKRDEFASWIARKELVRLGPELDAEITRSGAETCARATRAALDLPFSLELVAAYCKAVGGPMPGWTPRPLLVGGLGIVGSIAGTPPTEQPELERSLGDALEHSVWFSGSTQARGMATLQGSALASFSDEHVTLARPWTESVPYQSVEHYREAVDVPYLGTETYTESVPYTEYETSNESCRGGRDTCKVTRPVTRYRNESRTRQVERRRTEYRDRTRPVTLYRDEARVFRFAATRHTGRYQSSFFVRLDLGSGQRPIEARGSAEETKTTHEHDAEFPQAGVHPEHEVLPSAMAWRQLQRERIRAEVTKALDEAWTRSFCNEAVASIEEGARCAHARPKPAPRAVLVRVEQLVGDDPTLVLALPRPGEAVH